MPIVYGRSMGPAGGTGTPPKVEITLVGLDGTVRPGWSTDADEEVTLTTRVQPNPDGTWSVNLVGNARIYSPWGDTVYRVVEGFNDDLGRPHVYYIGVPATLGPYFVGDIRTGLVPDQPIEEINGVISVEGRTGVVDLSDLYVQRAGSTMTGMLELEASSFAGVVLQARAAGDAQPRLVVRASGAISLGSGSAVADTTLYRSTANTLRTDDTFEVLVATGTTTALNTRASGDTQPRLVVDASGKHTWGSGSSTGDTTLYRSGLDELTTDDSLVVGTRLAVGTTVGSDVVTVATTGSNAGLLVKATATGTAAKGVLAVETSGASKRAFDYRVTGDSVARLSVDGSAGSGSGTITWGNGTTADVNLYRGGADILSTDDTFTSGVAVQAPTVRGGTGSAGTLTLSSTSNATKGKVLIGSASLALDEANARVGIGTTSPANPLHVQGAAGTTSLVALDASGDSQRRLLIDASGAHTWGSGTAAGDTNLYRGAADTLKTDDSLVVATRATVGSSSLQSAQFHAEGAGTNQVLLAKATAAGTATIAVMAVETPTTGKRALDFRLTGDTVARLAVDASASSSGTLTFGDGTTADTNLYRPAADTLKTDDSFHVGATLRHLGSSLGFYNTSPVARPSLTYSRTGEPTSVAAIRTALAALGLVTDSTTA
ncbi:hypothetical protein [Microbispora rosea]|uniref:hypothetical protein n=1 Tax=Microbispora rosea TaxID=58117 RepID=UPI0004C30404|nr:hypothetical protein [Microbispora rosea]